MTAIKIISHGLTLVLEDAEQSAFQLGLTEDELVNAIKEIKDDYVLVPEDDPGLRFVDNELEII